MNTSSVYLSPAQAAEKLNVSPITIRHWCNQGRIKFVKTLGGHRRIPLSQIEQLNQASKTTLIEQRWLLLCDNPQRVQMMKNKIAEFDSNIDLAHVDSSFLLGIATTEQSYQRVFIDPELTFENSQYLEQILFNYFKKQAIQVELLKAPISFEHMLCNIK